MQFAHPGERRIFVPRNDFEELGLWIPEFFLCQPFDLLRFATKLRSSFFLPGLLGDGGNG